MAGSITVVALVVLAHPQKIPAQEPIDEIPQSSLTAEIQASPQNELFFADVLVRGQSVLEVGSLASLSADDRAQIINRRIASVLAQADSPEAVTVQFDPQREIAVLKVNNRILMTVTNQDALDFNVPIETLAEQWANRLNQAFTERPLAVDVLQRLTNTTRQLLRDTINLLPSLLGALVIILLTWIVAKGVRHAGLVWAEKTEGDRSAEILIGRLCYGGVWIIGAVIALTILGLDFATLLGTLGLTSVAIGFSLKDILSNYISGVILLAARPFRIQDQIVVGDYEGTVVQIQLRATTMRTYDGRLVYIPNQVVFQSSIINNTASPMRRSDVMVGVDYDSDLNEVKTLIEEALSSIEGIQLEPAPMVLVHELAASTINLKVRFWVDSRQQSFLQVTSTVTQAVKEKLASAQIEMPTEIYTIMLREPADSLSPLDLTPTE
ncbi:mechanosensitive ion channel family protein [Synechocystis salina]|uniref:Mechanosensitive ion channel family protein n=1 Tax=Synechocystis salina LEGE 00031 TaxID=1828736 RepID=A0ABR9VVX8_9SYNC|nr:mechanosensitive ion channel family protein [Synechocystis salina]MBE9242412.1 mechanosensitive ion channel family protein [Synechocystis salina LEGE 00041]MBE9255511.1 mechanosensitive ion channel family protein [Synechocystis salina LEGE 00031]